MSAPQSPRCPRSRKYPGLCGGLREARVDKKKKLNLVHYCVKILLTTVIMNMMTVFFLLVMIMIMVLSMLMIMIMLMVMTKGH